jgi:hypothetical protein
MEHSRTVIALLGPLGAGKDTLAAHLVGHHDFRRFAFADEIKRQYYAASGHSEEEFKAARGTALEERIRTALWEWSDRVKAECGPLCFVDAMVAALLDYGRPAVVTDIRTRDELEAMRGIGADIVLVLRFAPDEPVRMPELDRTIPGSRLRYSDLRPNDGLFVNVELDKVHPEVVGRAIEEWWAKRAARRE